MSVSKPEADQIMDPRDLLAALRRYYPAGASRALGLGRRPAVLVIDFIEGFTSARSPMGGPWDREIAATATLLECARSLQVPVIFTTVELDPGALATNLLYAKTPRIGILVRGSEWTAVDPRLAPRAQEPVISKQYASAFFGTTLAAHLQTMGVDSLLLCGCVTSGCVRATAVDAAQCGFRPAVVSEAVGDRSPLAHEANLIDIEQRYGDVLRLARALEALRTPGD